MFLYLYIYIVDIYIIKMYVLYIISHDFIEVYIILEITANYYYYYYYDYFIVN